MCRMVLLYSKGEALLGIVKHFTLTTVRADALAIVTLIARVYLC